MIIPYHVVKLSTVIIDPWYQVASGLNARLLALVPLSSKDTSVLAPRTRTLLSLHLQALHEASIIGLYSKAFLRSHATKLVEVGVIMNRYSTISS
jgi:hypothetical protein